MICICWFYYDALLDAVTVRHPLFCGDHTVLQLCQLMGVLLGVDHGVLLIQGIVWVLVLLHLLQYRHSPTTTPTDGAPAW